jgi:SAM-dependent methyltransferase
MMRRVDREDWNRRYAGAEFMWTADPNRFLAAEVAELPPGRALDLACGEGRNAVWLAEHGWEVTGVDFSEAGLGKGAKLAEERQVSVDWMLADLLDGYGGPKDPALPFTPEDIAGELAPLSIERAERVRRPVVSPLGEVYAIDALVRATKVDGAEETLGDACRMPQAS